MRPLSDVVKWWSFDLVKKTVPPKYRRPYSLHYPLGERFYITSCRHYLAVTMLVVGGITAVATGVVREIKAHVRPDFTIIIDGEKRSFADVNGNTVYPILYNGTTYLPLRAIGGLMGKDVGWDGTTNTVTLKNPTTQIITKFETMLSPGEAFGKGSYIDLAGVRFLFDGENFLVQNNRTDIIRVFCSVVGTKQDGTYVWLQSPSFGGVDKAQYENDLKENGWAVEQFTNMVRPNSSLVATLSVFDFSAFSETYPKADIDGDGYYDIIFTVRPQTSEDSIIISTSDPSSDIYKVKSN